MGNIITTGTDVYASRYPFLANLTYKAADNDQTYKLIVDERDSSWSPIPDGVETHAVGGLGPVQKRGETTAFAYDTPGPAGTKKTTYVNYALRVKFTENLIMDAQYGLIEKVVTDLGDGWNKMLNLEAAARYDDAFTGSLMTGPDGKALLADDHTSFMGGPDRRNILSTPAAFGYQSMQDLIVVANEQTDERGYPKVALKPSETIKVLIPPAMQFEAQKILDQGSAYDPESNKNAINVMKRNRWQIIVNPWLTSKKNWFLIDSSDTGIRLVKKQDLTPDSFQDDYDKGMNYDVRGRIVYHPEFWEFIYGSNG